MDEHDAGPAVTVDRPVIDRAIDLAGQTLQVSGIRSLRIPEDRAGPQLFGNHGGGFLEPGLFRSQIAAEAPRVRSDVLDLVHDRRANVPVPRFDRTGIVRLTVHGRHVAVEDLHEVAARTLRARNEIERADEAGDV